MYGRPLCQKGPGGRGASVRADGSDDALVLGLRVSSDSDRRRYDSSEWGGLTA